MSGWLRKPRVLPGLVRFLTPVDAAGLGCLLAYGLLSWTTRSSGDPSLHLFLGLAACVAVITFGLYAYYRRHPDQRLSVARLIGWAVAFRICGLFGGPLLRGRFL